MNHVTARGNAREDIYQDDIDCQQFLLLLQNTVNRYDWYCHAYCLMDNHYHLLIETNSPTLSKGRSISTALTRNISIGSISVLATCFKVVSKPSWCRKMPICWNWRVILP
ncbi:transposase [Nitrosomonas communis]|uniref:transposase n=1 Tax=Nitrosomonas communis TaxID=44574 RepID=UPI001C4310AD|nr:transposase [Nitrosomonas communis]